jgi:diguanylate cyclase (GGDEF)-like protein
MTLRNTADLTRILESNIKSGLISTSVAARSLLDIDRFDSYNSAEDIYNDWEAFQETLESLRDLKRKTGVSYIYTLKQIDGKYHFILDTDEEDEAIFDEYEISFVHEQAFLGKDYAGIMNVVDEYGSFNTGAVPIWKDGQVIGIISTDIRDMYINASRIASTRNAIVLILSLFATMTAMTIIAWLLLRNIRKMQEKLFHMANYDILTGLPNRQYLMSYLAETIDIAKSHNEPFAFLLIDLDNFKSVNDGSGHAAGDELLRHIALYLDNVHDDHSKSFRSSAGVLNFSARLGGDEFVQIVAGVRTIDEAQIVAKTVLDNFSSQTIDHYVEKYNVGLSIGVALYPYHTENYDVLIKYADMAMYHAKKNGKHAFCIYSDEMIQADPGEQPKLPAERRQFRSEKM